MIITSSSGIASARKTLLLNNDDNFPDGLDSIVFPTEARYKQIGVTQSETVIELSGNGILTFLATFNTTTLIPTPNVIMNNDGNEETIYLASSGAKYTVIVYDHAAKDQQYASPAIHFNNYLKITGVNNETETGYFRVYYNYYLNP
jgi:hypothetical protein